MKISLATLKQVVATGIAILEDVEAFEKEFFSIATPVTNPATDATPVTNSPTDISPINDTTPVTDTIPVTNSASSYAASPV